MTIGEIANAINECQKYVDKLHDFADNSSRTERMLDCLEADRLATVLQNLINFVYYVEMKHPERKEEY